MQVIQLAYEEFLEIEVSKRAGILKGLAHDSGLTTQD
jgi:hypothetical protein